MFLGGTGLFSAEYIVANKLGCTSTTSTQYIDESNVMEYTWQKYGSLGSILNSCVTEGCLDKEALNYNETGLVAIADPDLCKYEEKNDDGEYIENGAKVGIDDACAYNYTKGVTKNVATLSGWGKYKLL